MDPESFRGKVWLLVIDKLIIGAVIGLAFLCFTIWFHDRDRRLDDRSNKQKLELEKATFASQTLPSITNPSLPSDQRANLLSLLVRADAITPALVARLSQILIEEGVSERTLTQAIRPSLQKDLVPFLDEAEPLARNLRAQPMTQVCPGRNWGDTDDQHDNSDRDKALALWRSVFDALTSESVDDLFAKEGAFAQLNSEEFLSTHLQTVIRLFAPGSDVVARRYSRSMILGIRLTGDVALLELNSRDEQALQSVTSRISGPLAARPLSDVHLARQVRLARQVIEILKFSPEIFIYPSRGRIAIPLAKVLTTDIVSNDPDIQAEWSASRWDAGEALWRMLDCGQAATPVLLSYVNAFIAELNNASGDKQLEVLRVERGDGKLVRRAIDLLGTMNTPNARAWIQRMVPDSEKPLAGLTEAASASVDLSMRSISELPDEKLRYFPFLKESAARYVETTAHAGSTP